MAVLLTLSMEMGDRNPKVAPAYSTAALQALSVGMKHTSTNLRIYCGVVGSAERMPQIKDRPSSRQKPSKVTSSTNESHTKSTNRLQETNRASSSSRSVVVSQLS